MPGAVGVAGSSPQNRKSKTSPAKIRQGRDQMLDYLFHPQCAEAKSKDIGAMIPEAINVACLGVVLFRDKGWDSPNCRRHAQCMTCSASLCVFEG